MTDAYPQAWIEIGAHAIYDADPESEHPDEELEGCRTIAELILDAVVPDIRAEGAAAEREACAQLAEQKHALCDEDPAKPLTPFADLIRARTTP